MIRACLIALALSYPTLSGAQTSQIQPPLTDLQYGVICDIHLDGQTEAPGTLSGHINIVDQTREIDVISHAVPAQLGLSFGIRAEFLPETVLPDAIVVVTHPPMGAQQVTRQAWAAPLDDTTTSVNLFTFEHPFELVQGPWTFQLLSQDRVLVQTEFLVVGENDAPKVQEACFARDLSV